MAALVGELDALGKACPAEQQAGDELGRTGSIDGDLPAFWHVVGGHRKGKAIAFYINAEAAQRIQRRGHGAVIGLLIAIDAHRAIRQRRDRWHKAHHGAGQPAIHRGTVQLSRLDVDIGPLMGEANPHGAERILHQLRIARYQRGVQDRRGISQRGQDEGAIGNRFRSWHLVFPRNGAGSQRGGPRLRHSVHNRGHVRKIRSFYRVPPR